MAEAAGLSGFESVALLMAAVAVVTVAFKRMGWNPILGLIAAGIAFGPSGFALVETTGAVAKMAEMGILFLLFIIGVELSIERVQKMAKYVFGLGGVHYVISTILIGAFAWAFGLSAMSALMIGIAITTSSTAFVLQMLSETNQLEGQHGRMTFAVLLFQDMMVAPTLAFISVLAGMVAVDGSVQEHRISLIPAAVAMAILFIVAKLVLHQLVGAIHETDRQNYFLAAIISVALSMGLAAHHLGLSASLGAFLAGLALSDGEWRHDVKDTMKPLESTFLGIFFISIGMQVPLDLGVGQLTIMTAVAVMVIAIKAGAGFLAGRVMRIDARRAFRVGLSLAQAGEFAFILIAAAGPVLLAPEVARFWTGVAVLSLISTPVLVAVSAKLRQPEPAVASETLDSPRDSH